MVTGIEGTFSGTKINIFWKKMTQSSPAPRPEPLPSKALTGKHCLFTHFPKDPNCEICKRTKVTRAAGIRNSQCHMFLATKFGDINEAHHKVFNEEEEPRNNQRYATVVQELATQWIQSYPWKNKNIRRNGEKSTEVFSVPGKSKGFAHSEFIEIWRSL